MSANDNTQPVTFEGAAGDSTKVAQYNPPEQAPSRIRINGVRVPVVEDGLNLEIRKSDRSMMSRFGTFQTVSYWDDNDVLSLLSGRGVTGYPECTVEIRRPTDGQFVPVMIGYVSGWGHQQGRVIQVEIKGAEQLVRNLPAKKPFTTSATVLDAANYVASEIEESVPTWESVNVVRVSSAESTETYTSLNAASDVQGIRPDNDKFGRVTYLPHRDTLSDVFARLRKRMGVRHYFRPVGEDSLELVLIRDDEVPNVASTYRASSLPNGTVDVLENRLLSRLRPLNAIRVVGGAIASREAKALDSQYQVETPPTKYVEAVATYPPLVERAGGRIVGEEIVVDESTQTKVEQTAKTELKDRLDGDAQGVGQMITQLDPRLGVWNRLVARPVHRNNTANDTNPLSWELSAVRHTTDIHDPVPNTKLHASLEIDPRKIEVESSWKEI